MTTFPKHLEGHGLSDKTIRAYVIDMGLFAAWYKQTNGERFTALFTPTDVREYKAHLQTRDAAPATINRKLASLRAWGTYLVATGQADHNPADHARGVKEQKAAPKWLDKQEQARLTRELERAALAARQTHTLREATRNQAIVCVLMHTGLRVAELCALGWDDVTLRPRSGVVVVRNGKGEKRREVPLNLEARGALAAWGDECERDDQPEDGPVFTGRTGERLQAGGVQKMIAELGRRAKIEHLTPHMLRHTFAKNLRNAGVGLEQVAALMGHSSIETTAIYTVPDAHDLARAVETLED